MLMNHHIFHFTQIPDKTNEVIFLKSPKTMFFGPFLTIKKSKNHVLWAPNTMLSFRKN